ncbi:unnamed protein product [Paramecium primaurelia]|uniref:Cyclic nucleotide-binding domain-containing protein n=2 Tax=Paramecium primaurelia TaxID=5886 RepID=A0A8S1QMS8_PARPR|nr:unnamed protein product [Paramecium primaurelia]
MLNLVSNSHSPTSTQRQFYQTSGPLKGILKNKSLYGDNIDRNSLQGDKNVEDELIEQSFLSQGSFHAHKNSNNQVAEQKSNIIKQASNKLGRLNNVWRNKSLNIIYYISKFARQLKTSANKIKFKLLTRRILDLIRDLGSDTDELLRQRDNQYHKKTVQTMKCFNKVLNKIQYLPIIEPDSIVKLSWDIIVLLAIVINIIYIPLELSFSVDMDQTTQLCLNTLPSWLFVVDIFVTLQTAFYAKGIIHRNQIEIFKNYLKGGTLILDIIIVIPILLSSLNFSFFKYALLLRIFRLPKIASNIEEIINPNQQVKAIISLIKLIYFILITCHFCACMWAFLGETQLEYGLHSWIAHYQIDDSNWRIKYIYSFYYSAITTLTIGYGDITPQTIPEKIYTIFLALLVCGVLGYSVSTVGEIIKQLQEKNQVFKEKMSLVTNYVKSRKLNKQLQLQVRKYFEHYFKLEEKSQIEAEELMQKLTVELKQKVTFDLYCSILKQSKVLSNLCDSCLQKLCLVAHEQKYAPEEIIWKQNEQASKLIFLVKGKLELMANDIGLKSWKKGVIGEREFASQTTYITYLKASKFSQVVYIEYSDLQRILGDHQEDLEKIKMLQDNLIFNENYKTFGNVCEVCEWTHSIEKCPFVFIKVNKTKIMNKFKETKEQNRLFSDRNIFRYTSRKKISDIQECALAMIINEKFIHQLDITDAYLQQLGFALDVDEQQNGSGQQRQNTQREQTALNDTFTVKSNTNKDNLRKQSDSFSNDVLTYSGQMPPIVPHQSIPSPQISQKLSMNKKKDVQANVKQPESTTILRKLKRENSQNIEKRIQFVQSQLSESKELRKNSKLDSWRSIEQNLGITSNKKISYTSQASVSLYKQKSLQKQISLAASPRKKKNSSSVAGTLNSRTSKAQYVNSNENDDMVIIMEEAEERTIEYCDFDLDKQFIMTIYFPIFNYDGIIKKIQFQYQQKQISIKASMKKSKTLQRLMNDD